MTSDNKDNKETFESYIKEMKNFHKKDNFCICPYEEYWDKLKQLHEADIKRLEVANEQMNEFCADAEQKAIEKDKQISELKDTINVLKDTIGYNYIHKLENKIKELQAEINKWKELAGISCEDCKRK